jgi:hypothetical protein
MRTAVDLYKRVTASVGWPLYAIPLRLVVGFGFMEHGYAKLARGPESFAAILHALGMPAPTLFAWITIVVELFGRLLNDLKSAGYKVVFMKPKFAVTTIASYDEVIMKQVKGPASDGRSISSVVRTISE